MSESTLFDAVVIGGGPAGIFAAHKLAALDRRAVLLEAGGPMLQSLCPKIRVTMDGRLTPGSERFRLQCPRCSCLTGLGGAAFHFDTNLGYRSALSRSRIERGANGKVKAFSSLERALGSFERAERAVREVFEVLHAHGLEPPRSIESAEGDARIGDHFDGADLSPSHTITVGTALQVIDSLLRSFRAAGGEVRFSTRATAIRGGVGAPFVVSVETQGEPARELEARSVVVAVGKLGLRWVRETVQRLGIDAPASDSVDLGVRLEAPRERLAPLAAACANPKLAYINARGEAVRTFCICAGGRIMQYEFGDAVLLDGQHCLTNPTRFSNFGIVTTVKVPAGLDGTEFALGWAGKVSRRGAHRPVVCTIGELRRSGSGAGTFSPSATLDTSLIDYERVSLAECLSAPLVEDVLGMVDRLNASFPGMIGESAMVAAPVVERLFPRIALTPDMESSTPGLYFVGDASSKIIGVTYGAATGMIAAAAIAAARDN